LFRPVWPTSFAVATVSVLREHPLATNAVFSLPLRPRFHASRRKCYGTSVAIAIASGLFPFSLTILVDATRSLAEIRWLYSFARSCDIDTARTPLHVNNTAAVLNRARGTDSPTSDRNVGLEATKTDA
jgi:hypothetical protein